MTAALKYSKKAFLAIALLAAVLSCSVAVVYAQVTVGTAAPLTGAVTYSLTNAEDGTWTTTAAPSCPTAPWYSKLEINSAGYTGPVTVTWKLQQKTGVSNWTDISGAAMSTSITLTGNDQSIYATTNGVYGQSNYNWGQNVTTSGTYRVVATVTA